MQTANDDDGQTESDSSSPLFTPEGSPSPSPAKEHVKVALQEAPFVEGLFHFNQFLSSEECQEIVENVIDCHYFNTDQGRDQAVLFGMRNNSNSKEHDESQPNGLPHWAQMLLRMIEERLRVTYKDTINKDILDILYNPSPETEYTRQMILNIYTPGQGIADHIDIPHRFLDGIMILSFGSGISMDFAPTKNKDGEQAFSLYLQPGSICILTGKSRWEWTHGIPAQTYDLVHNKQTDQVHRIERSARFSITIRWLKIQPESSTNTNDDIAQSNLRSHQT
ncbi:uncharacterized protein FA14DRAFT_26194 [Meira miltonrushii]|uniref:Fe2OG dioxygenase domain-containing protein n=1 Tax=Meira miltonrushii TaxID=1280837 RepID=A0A316VPL6_9BASI|nr:uncharacterized protein FA14DRAFT_26194 [Meira miltonrushii]PWN38363.1 hypothetical protein FA14DRAFT_26194 [Meira miltonrushii]